MSSKPENFANLMEQLRQEYMADFDSKLMQLRTLMVKPDAQILRNEFHKLRGTGASYGFTSITLIGELGEELILKNADLNDIIPKLIAMLENVFTAHKNKTPLDIEADKSYKQLKQKLEQ